MSEEAYEAVQAAIAKKRARIDGARLAKALFVARLQCRVTSTELDIQALSVCEGIIKDGNLTPNQRIEYLYNWSRIMMQSTGQLIKST